MLQSSDESEKRLLALLAANTPNSYIQLFQILILTTHLSSDALASMGDKANIIYAGIIAGLNENLVTKELLQHLFDKLRGNNVLTGIFECYKAKHNIDFKRQLIDTMCHRLSAEEWLVQIKDNIRLKIAGEPPQFQQDVTAAIQAIETNDEMTLDQMLAKYSKDLACFRPYSPSASLLLIASAKAPQRVQDKLFKALLDYSIEQMQRNPERMRYMQNKLFIWACLLNQSSHMDVHIQVVPDEVLLMCLKITKISNWQTFLRLAAADPRWETHTNIYFEEFNVCLMAPRITHVVDLLNQVFSNKPLWQRSTTNPLASLFEAYAINRLAPEDVEMLLILLLETGAPCTNNSRSFTFSSALNYEIRVTSLIGPLSDIHSRVTTLLSCLTNLKDTGLKSEVYHIVGQLQAFMLRNKPGDYYQKAEVLRQIVALFKPVLEKLEKMQQEEKAATIAAKPQRTGGFFDAASAYIGEKAQALKNAIVDDELTVLIKQLQTAQQELTRLANDLPTNRREVMARMDAAMKITAPSAGGPNP